jgi:hypothetical protein
LLFFSCSVSRGLSFDGEDMAESGLKGNVNIDRDVGARGSNKLRWLYLSFFQLGISFVDCEGFSFQSSSGEEKEVGRRTAKRKQGEFIHDGIEPRSNDGTTLGCVWICNNLLKHVIVFYCSPYV